MRKEKVSVVLGTCFYFLISGSWSQGGENPTYSDVKNGAGLVVMPSVVKLGKVNRIPFPEVSGRSIDDNKEALNWFKGAVGGLKETDPRKQLILLRSVIFAMKPQLFGPESGILDRKALEKVKKGIIDQIVRLKNSDNVLTNFYMTTWSDVRNAPLDKKVDVAIRILSDRAKILENLAEGNRLKELAEFGRLTKEPAPSVLGAGEEEDNAKAPPAQP